MHRLVRRVRLVVLAAVLLAPTASAWSMTVGLAGVFSGRALLLIDGQVSRSVAVGRRTPEGIHLVSVGDGEATVEIDGQRRVLRLGRDADRVAGGEQESVTLAPDSRGHFVTMGLINGRPMRFVVDTGASLVSLGAADAKRLGLDLARAESVVVQTAAGTVPARRVRLETVVVGGVTVRGVDALVQENDLPVALLGMSFLNRMEIRREGDTLTLKKRF